MPRTVSAIVVNWRQPELTSAAVTSLEEQVGRSASGDDLGIELRVVIVDNASGDGSAELLRSRHPQHRVVETPTNGGFGSGVNAAIRSATADFYLLLNNDAVVRPGFVAALIDEMDSAPRVGAVTGRILLAGRFSRVDTSARAGAGAGALLRGHDGSLWRADPAGSPLVNSTGNEMTLSGNGRDRDWLRPADATARPSGEVFGFSGGAALLRATALEEVGLFDESLFMYYEDTELSWRLRRAGWTVRYASGAEVEHAHAASSGTGSDLFRFYNERNRVLVSAMTAPSAVVARALARTGAGTARAVISAATARTPASRSAARHVARRRLRSLSAALKGLPAALAERRRVDRSASVSRAEVARLLVAG
ncbi:glycosyltransferase family 2 protein [Herbiconiux sp. CPCC 205763]|uniref:Glycosyltransferase family 2 protein n=1 Tax=Herbiconiux aconitum TaxID=2970913 RepID=A0ABT2GK77_9MICO|nr:glycosyltransferase family 2 protein [Herbiconiux aconitum]MCS5716619.1 glycosyltransferase family 2 protein [Herbiconiux aconitum]